MYEKLKHKRRGEEWDNYFLKYNPDNKFKTKTRRKKPKRRRRKKLTNKNKIQRLLGI